MEARGVETMARRFCANGPVRRVEPLDGGHIHQTWMVESGEGGFVLQGLNNEIFADCVQMMDNVLRVASHLARAARRSGVADPERRAVQVLPTADGALLAYDADLRPWRAFRRIDGAMSQAVVESPAVAHEVGRAFGRFFVQVQDLPGRALEETIPGFKDFRRRKDDFEFVVDVDPFGRASTCRREIEGVRHYHRLVKTIAAAWDSDRLPVRIVHNDAKAANVLLDGSTGEALCVIDLDTVAYGTVLYDIGDLLRSATVTSAEDAIDLGGLAVRDNLLEAALDGYLSEAGDILTAGERDFIPMAGPLMAYEAAMRFLTDHLAGDTYFRIDRPRHNLDRARTQLRVLEVLDRAGDRVAALVAAAAKA